MVALKLLADPAYHVVINIRGVLGNGPRSIRGSFERRNRFPFQ